MISFEKSQVFNIACFKTATMTAQNPSLGEKKRRLLLFALSLAVFSAWLITVTFQLLLINIAHTFNVPIGTAGLVSAVGSISGIAAGLLMAVFSIRFNHKLFLIVGLLCTSLATVGFYLAPNFNVVLLTNIAVGTGIAFATSMAYSLIGDYYPLQKRGRAVGCIVASTGLSLCRGGTHYWCSCRPWRLAFNHDLAGSSNHLVESSFSLFHNSQRVS